MVFVDFNKAFDTVVRTGLWQLLKKYGCPEKFTTMIESLHTGMMANVSVGGEVSESLCYKCGQARLCTGPHALLFLPISNARRGFPRHGRWRLHTVQTERWPIQRRTLLSEDQDSDTDERAAIRGWHCIGCTLCWRDAENSGCVSDASKKFGLKINIKKIEVLYQPNSTRTREEDIMVDGNKLNSVLEFTYLGSNISSNGCIDNEIQRRMAKVSTSFGRLRQRLWNNHHVSMRVKGKIYIYIVQSRCPPSYTEPRPWQCTGDRWKTCMPSWCDICVLSWG